MQRAYIALLASLMLLSVSCNQTAPTTGTQPSSDSVSVSTDIRPTSKGQRLELASLEGELEVPAGTSSYVIQSADYALAQAPVLDWIMPAAEAQENTDPTGDEPLDPALLAEMQVTVNGETVDFEILKTEEDENGNLIVTYRLKNVPVTDDNAIVEFASPSGAFKIKGLVPRIAQDMKRFDERFTPDSTALVEVIQQYLPNARGLTQEQIDHLQRTSFVQQARNQILGVFIQPPDPRHPPRFDDEIPKKIKDLPLPPDFQTWVGEAKQCFQERRSQPRRGQAPQPCASPPPLPPRADSPPPLPASIQKVIQRRLEFRKERRQDAPPPPPPSDESTASPAPREQVPTGPLTMEEILNLGPVVRRAYCIRSNINPCPGL